MGSGIFGAASANSDSQTEITKKLCIFKYFKEIVIHELLVPFLAYIKLSCTGRL